MLGVLDRDLINFIAKLDEGQKRSLLGMMESFLKPDDVKMQSLSINEYNQELDEAMHRMDLGEFSTLEDLVKEMDSWQD